MIRQNSVDLPFCTWLLPTRNTKRQQSTFLYSLQRYKCAFADLILPAFFDIIDKCRLNNICIISALPRLHSQAFFISTGFSLACHRSTHKPPPNIYYPNIHNGSREIFKCQYIFTIAHMLANKASILNK